MSVQSPLFYVAFQNVLCLSRYAVCGGDRGATSETYCLRCRDVVADQDHDLARLWTPSPRCTWFAHLFVCFGNATEHSARVLEIADCNHCEVGLAKNDSQWQDSTTSPRIAQTGTSVRLRYASSPIFPAVSESFAEEAPIIARYSARLPLPALYRRARLLVCRRSL